MLTKQAVKVITILLSFWSINLLALINIKSLFWQHFLLTKLLSWQMQDLC